MTPTSSRVLPGPESVAVGRGRGGSSGSGRGGGFCGGGGSSPAARCAPSQTYVLGLFLVSAGVDVLEFLVKQELVELAEEDYQRMGWFRIPLLSGLPCT